MRVIKIGDEVVFLLKDDKKEFDDYLPLDVQEAFKVIKGSKVIQIPFSENLIEELRNMANVLEKIKEMHGGGFSAEISRRYTVLEIIRRLEEEQGSANIDVVIRKAKELGIEDVESILERLEKDGAIHKTKENVVKVAK